MISQNVLDLGCGTGLWAMYVPCIKIQITTCQTQSFPRYQRILTTLISLEILQTSIPHPKSSASICLPFNLNTYPQTAGLKSTMSAHHGRGHARVLTLSTFVRYTAVWPTGLSSTEKAMSK